MADRSRVAINATRYPIEFVEVHRVSMQRVFFLSSLCSFCSTLENNCRWKEETNPRRSVSGKERAELIARVNGGNHAKHDTPLSV